ncbi:MAG: tetratricopeptide repeat protein [Pseudonocardiaceae bacterium]
MTYRASLAASYQVAFDRLAVEESAALDLLTLAAHLAPEPIPFTLFTAHADLLPEPLAATVGDPLAFASLTQALRRRALARISTNGFQLHRLVQAILLSRQADGAAGDDTAAVALCLLRETVPADPWNNPETWQVWRQLLPHVLTVTSRDPEPTDEDVAWLLDSAAAYLHTQGSPRLARRLSERAFELYQRLLGENHPAILTSASHLAMSLYALGAHQQARRLNEDALIRSRRIRGEDHAPAPWLWPTTSPMSWVRWASTSKPANSTRTPSPAPAESWGKTTPTPCARRSSLPSAYASWASTSKPVSSSSTSAPTARADHSHSGGRLR